MKTRLISLTLLMWSFMLYGHDLPVKLLIENNKQTHIVKSYDLNSIDIAKEFYFRAQFINYDEWFATHFPNIIDSNFRADHAGISHMNKLNSVTNTGTNPIPKEGPPYQQHPIIDPLLKQMIAAFGSEKNYNDRDGISQIKASQINDSLSPLPDSNDHYVIAAMVGLSICNAISSVDITNSPMRLVPRFIGPQTFLDGNSRDPNYINYHIRDGLKFQCVYQTEGFILNKDQFMEYNKLKMNKAKGVDFKFKDIKAKGHSIKLNNG